MARILLYGDQPHERQYPMSEKKIEIKGPNLPLDPIVGETDPEYPEIKAAHNALLAEFKRLDEICLSQVEGVSWGFDKEKRLYSVEEYNEMLAAYRAARKAYVGRYRKKLETIDMVREKIRKLQEEEERFAAANGCNEIEEPPDLPDFEEVPNEPWENFIKRQKNIWTDCRRLPTSRWRVCKSNANRTSFSFAVLRRWGSSENWNTSLNYAFDTHTSTPRPVNKSIVLTMTLARA